MTLGTDGDLVAVLARLRQDPDAVPQAADDAIMAIRDRRIRDRVPLDDPQLRAAIPVLMSFLRDTNTVTLEWACQTLGWLKAREALPDLLDLLRPEAAAERNIQSIPVFPFAMPYPEADEAAINALRIMGATEVVPQLLDALGSPNANARTAACDALEGLQAEPQLAAQLVHGDARVREAVSGHFRGARYRRMGAGTLPADPDLEAALLTVLASGGCEARRAAGEVLGRVGSSLDVIVALKETLSREDLDAETARVLQQAAADVLARRPAAGPGQVSVAAAGRVSLPTESGAGEELPPADD
jgi:hypothetical protein